MKKPIQALLLCEILALSVLSYAQTPSPRSSYWGSEGRGTSASAPASKGSIQMMEPVSPYLPGDRTGPKPSQTMPPVSPFLPGERVVPSPPPIAAAPAQMPSTVRATDTSTPLTPRQAAGAALEGRDIYYDADGLIVHAGADGKVDGGDTAQREGWYWLGVWLRQNTPGLTPWQTPRRLNFEQVLRLLEPKGDGVFYRHPKLPPWNNAFSKEWGTSRDQLVPLIAAMGVYGQQDRLRRLWDALPEDILGKHAFNGNWRNALGQDGPNCGDIKKRGCDATRDCSLRVDNRDCSLREDTRNCTPQVDTRSCSQPHDERSCHTWLGNDPFCEAAKAAQNVAYESARVACETAKGTQNGIYRANMAGCEAAKGAANAQAAQNKLSCEAGKASQNAVYAAEKGACETGKTAAKYACEADKQSAYQLCRNTNVFSGDLIGPSSTNLFRRAINQDPIIPLPADAMSLSIAYGGPTGDSEMLVGSQLRVSASRGNRDDVGDDLNHIVHLVMAQLRYPSKISNAASVTYYSNRSPSYGSFLGSYYSAYGADMNDVVNRMNAGIASGWKPEGNAIFGAVHWYHRPSSGANPMLATLWQPIIERYRLQAGVAP